MFPKFATVSLLFAAMVSVNAMVQHVTEGKQGSLLGTDGITSFNHLSSAQESGHSLVKRGDTSWNRDEEMEEDLRWDNAELIEARNRNELRKQEARFKKCIERDAKDAELRRIQQAREAEERRQAEEAARRKERQGQNFRR